MGNGGWGVGNGEWGVGNGESGMGSRKADSRQLIAESRNWGLGNGDWGLGDYGPSFTPFSFHEQTGSFLYRFFFCEVFFNLFKSTASGVCRRGDAFQGWSYFTRHSVTES